MSLNKAGFEECYKFDKLTGNACNYQLSVKSVNVLRKPSEVYFTEMHSSVRRCMPCFFVSLSYAKTEQDCVRQIIKIHFKKSNDRTIHKLEKTKSNLCIPISINKLRYNVLQKKLDQKFE